MKALLFFAFLGMSSLALSCSDAGIDTESDPAASIHPTSAQLAQDWVVVSAKTSNPSSLEVDNRFTGEIVSFSIHNDSTLEARRCSGPVVDRCTSEEIALLSYHQASGTLSDLFFIYANPWAASCYSLSDGEQRFDLRGDTLVYLGWRADNLQSPTVACTSSLVYLVPVGGRS